MYDNDKIDMLKLNLEEQADKDIFNMECEYSNIRAGRINPHILDKVFINYYGNKTAINQLATISVENGRCIIIKPWDLSIIKEIEKQIIVENLGVMPINVGKEIKLNFPALSEELRNELVKDVKKIAENYKVKIRNIRRDILTQIKQMKNQKELTENEQKFFESQIDEHINKKILKIDEILKNKQKDIITL